jgi:hypothetical protein
MRFPLLIPLAALAVAVLPPRAMAAEDFTIKMLGIPAPGEFIA